MALSCPESSAFLFAAPMERVNLLQRESKRGQVSYGGERGHTPGIGKITLNERARSLQTFNLGLLWGVGSLTSDGESRQEETIVQIRSLVIHGGRGICRRMGKFEETKVLSARQTSISRPGKVTCAGMFRERCVLRTKGKKEAAPWELWS